MLGTQRKSPGIGDWHEGSEQSSDGVVPSPESLR